MIATGQKDLLYSRYKINSSLGGISKYEFLHRAKDKN